MIAIMIVTFTSVNFLQIVPPNQAELMFESIKKKGIPCALVMFEGKSSLSLATSHRH